MVMVLLMVINTPPPPHIQPPLPHIQPPVSGRRASSQEKRRRSNLNLHHPALPPTDAVAIEVGESGPDSSPLTSHGGVGGGVLGGGGGTGTVPQGASHMDSGVSHGVHVTGGRKGEMVHGEKDKMKEEKTGNEKRGEKDTEAMVDAFTDAAVDEHHARERRRDEVGVLVMVYYGIH